MDWEKWTTNGWHMVLLLSTAYIAAHPGDGYGWALPVLQFYASTAPPPNFKSGGDIPLIQFPPRG